MLASHWVIEEKRNIPNLKKSTEFDYLMVIRVIYSVICNLQDWDFFRYNGSVKILSTSSKFLNSVIYNILYPNYLFRLEYSSTVILMLYN